MSARTPFHPILIATLLLAIVVLCLPGWWPASGRVDFLWLDRLTAQQAQREQADAHIVLVDIDDYSLRAMADTVGRWPWPRATHAELIEWLLAQGAQAVAFDIWFSEPDIQRPEFDQYLGEVLDKHDNVFLPTLLMNSLHPEQSKHFSSYPTNLPLRASAQADPNARGDLLLPAMGSPNKWRLGLINFVADDDGIARHYQLFREQQGWQLQSLPLIVASHLGIDSSHTPTSLRIRWFGNGADSPYTRYSYADLWAQVQAGQPLDLRDKVVFVGATAAGLHDLRPTPLNAQYPGLYLLANAFDNLKNQQSLQYAAWYGLVIGLPWLAWLFWRLHRQKPLLATVSQSAFIAVLLTAASQIAISQHLLLPLITPTIASLLLLGAGTGLRYWQEHAAKRAAIDLFGRFLDPVVVQQLAEEGLNEQTQASKNCEISVLFSDIRGFTSMSEKASAAEIMTLLNAYFTRQVGVIFKNHGTLDKFIGDAIMAFWGAPLPDEQHAIHAVSAALDMVDALEGFKQEHQLEGFDVGIGIHSGPAVVGMLGCEQRLEYTAIGDTVNLGSRLEGVTKGIARILVSQSTRDLCGDRFDFIAHGSCTVKGREEPVYLYEPRRKAI